MTINAIKLPTILNENILREEIGLPFFYICEDAKSSVLSYEITRILKVPWSIFGGRGIDDYYDAQGKTKYF